MRHGVITLITVTLLIGLISAAPPATSQEPPPTPRGQLGGREPLALTPVLPTPTAFITPRATPVATTSPPSPATAPALGTPAATPIADDPASPASTP